MDWSATDVFFKNFDAVSSGKYRYIINEGGSRSSKSTSLIQLYLIIASQGLFRMTCWRQRRTWIKDSLYSDFIKYLKTTGIYLDNDENKSELKYKFRGSVIEFNGLDDYQKLHGLTQDYAWFNEGMEATKEDFDQIDMRTEKAIFIDYNPTEEQHWIYELARHPQSIFIRSTVLDNTFIASAIRNKILSYEPTAENINQGTADEYNWKVYGLGIRAKKEGLIFKYEIIEEWPDDAEVFGVGLDFGFYPDPSASVRVGRYNGRLVMDEIFYEHNLLYIKAGTELSSIEEKLRPKLASRNEKIIADSQAKTGIEQLRAAGFNIEGYKKYPGSVLDGIRLMQQYEPFFITLHSMNLKKELDNYRWAIDHRTGKTMDEPIDDYNHLIDAVRYISAGKLVKHKMKIRAKLPEV